MDNVEALSKIYDQWCKVNNMPKHENGNYYSADDIMLDHYQDMPFEPTTKQVEFLSAFGKVWDEVAHYEKRYCFTDVTDGDQFRVAKVIENEKGYHPLGKANPSDPHELDKFVGKQDHIRAIVDNMNKHLGINKETEMQIKFSTF